MPLNPGLYAALQKCFGHVHISNEGERAQIYDLHKWWHGRLVKERRAEGGEYYSVNCPYCGDNRGRLEFNYLWGTRKGPLISGLWMHLVHCHNEYCIDSEDRQWELSDRIFSSTSRHTGVTLPVESLDETDAPSEPRQFELPGGSVPLGDLPEGHHAVQYLVGRGFDCGELDRIWGVRYCVQSLDSRPAIANRLVIPIEQAAGGSGDGAWRLAGWQARLIEPASADVPKYLTAAGMSKSGLLYGLRNAGSPGEVVVLTEGVTDVWGLAGNAVASLGKTLSRKQRQLMLSQFAGRPVAIAYDRDAVAEAQRVRNQLLMDRRAQQDAAPVVLVEQPAGRKDVGDCTRAEAWAAVASSLEAAVGDPEALADMLPTHARIDVVTGNKWPNPLAMKRIGSSVAVAYGETTNEQLAVTLVGEDDRLRHIVEPSPQWFSKLQPLRHIYDDMLAARQIELRRGIPSPPHCEDITTMRRLLGEEVEHNPQESLLTRAERSRRLWDAGDLSQRIELAGLKYIYEKIEKPLIEPIAKMMAVGVLVNRPKLQKLAGQSGTRQAARSLLKAIADDGRIHGQIDPLGAATGRMACRAPNLLGLDARLRDAIVAPAGHELIEVDYSQFELRVTAQLSHDERLVEAFLRGTDVYRETVALSRDLSVADISEEDRPLGKHITLPAVFGVGARRLAELAQISEDDAQYHLSSFEAYHPTLTIWRGKLQASAKQVGFVKTMYGRRRCLPADEIGQKAVNSVVQGTAADIFKLAIVRLHRLLPATATMLLPIHDAVLLEAPDAQVNEVVHLCRQVMTTPPPRFAVPLEVEARVGKSWGTMRRVE